MNVFLRCLACVAMVMLSAGRAIAADTFFLIRVSDMTRVDTLQVVSADELKELQKTLQLEERHFPKAIAQAVEEWRKDEMNKTTPFPAGKIVARKIIGQPEKFAARDKAEERIVQYEDREARKRLRDLEKASKTKPTPAEKAKADREIDKELAARRAADLVAVKLSALTGIPIETADPFAKNKPDEKAPVDKKVDEKAPEGKKVDEKAPEGKKVDEKAPAGKKDAGAAVDKAL